MFRRIIFNRTLNSHYFRSSRSYRSFLAVEGGRSRCRSDIDVLSYFLLGVDEGVYVHDDTAIVDMVGVVSRLTQTCETVKEVVEQIKPPATTGPKALFLLQRIYWFGGMYDRVVEVFDEIFNSGFTPDKTCTNTIMDVLLNKTGHIETPPTEVPNFFSYSVALRHLCKLGDPDNVGDVVKIMLRKSYFPYMDTWFAILDCYCKAGRMPEAKQIVSVMIALEIPVSTRIWGLLINGYCEAGKPDVAYRLLDKMVECGYSPNSEVCTLLIKLYLASEVPSKAFCILDIMRTKGCFPDLLIWNEVMNYYIKVGRVGDAANTLSFLCDQGFVPDWRTKMWLYMAIYFKPPTVDMPFRGLLSHVEYYRRSLIFTGILKAGDTRLANRLLDNPGPLPDVAYNSAIRGLVNDQFDDAYAFFCKMKEVGLVPSERSYNLILAALCERSDAGMVKHILREMVDASVEVHPRTLKSMKNLLQRWNNCSLLEDITAMIDSKYLLSGKHHHRKKSNSLACPRSMQPLHSVC